MTVRFDSNQWSPALQKLWNSLPAEKQKEISQGGMEKATAWLEEHLDRPFDRRGTVGAGEMTGRADKLRSPSLESLSNKEAPQFKGEFQLRLEQQRASGEGRKRTGSLFEKKDISSAAQEETSSVQEKPQRKLSRPRPSRIRRGQTEAGPATREGSTRQPSVETKETRGLTRGAGDEDPGTVDVAPTGTAYGFKAELTPEQEQQRVFAEDGSVDAKDALNKLTQFDTDKDTDYDASRCGPTAAIGAAIASGDPEKIENLANAVEKRSKATSPSPLSQEEQEELAEIQKKLAADPPTVSYADLGKLSELTMKAYEIDPEGGATTLQMREICLDMGFKPPKGAGEPKDVLDKGEAWPVAIDTDKDGEANHWIVAGKDKEGRDYVYDPLPQPDQPQIYYKDDKSTAAGYKAYVDHGGEYAFTKVPSEGPAINRGLSREDRAVGKEVQSIREEIYEKLEKDYEKLRELEPGDPEYATVRQHIEKREKIIADIDNATEELNNGEPTRSVLLANMGSGLLEMSAVSTGDLEEAVSRWQPYTTF